jgi:hypothetical protein
VLAQTLSHGGPQRGLVVDEQNMRQVANILTLKAGSVNGDALKR